jgi:TRAP-type C4-dicarboxylate transport system permease small subunit
MVKKWYEQYSAVVDRVSALLGGLAAGLIVGTSGLIVFAVVLRYVLSAPFKHTEEISSYLLVAIVFFGLAYTLKEGGHVRVELVMRMFPLRARRILARTTAIVGLVFAVELLVGVIAVWQKFYVNQSESYGLLHAPLWIPVTPLVVGAVALLLQLTVEIVRGAHTPE